MFIDPDTNTSPRSVNFSWPALSVTSAKTYQVAVYRNGKLQGTPESFLLRPRLVSDHVCDAEPVLPVDRRSVQGHHERCVRPRRGLLRYRGACLQAEQQREVLWGPRSERRPREPRRRGPHAGTGTAGTTTATTSPKATTSFGSGPTTEAWHRSSRKRTKVTIARTYRATKTKSKTASAYHHVGPVTPLVLGGGCIVFRSNGNLQILCQGARVSVYWGWGLSPVERIEHASFVLDTVEGCPRSIRRTGHTKHMSSFTMNEDLVGASGDCHLVTAKITVQLPEGVVAPRLPNPHRPEPQSRGP